MPYGLLDYVRNYLPRPNNGGQVFKPITVSKKQYREENKLFKIRVQYAVNRTAQVLEEVNYTKPISLN